MVNKEKNHYFSPLVDKKYDQTYHEKHGICSNFDVKRLHFPKLCKCVAFHHGGLITGSIQQSFKANYTWLIYLLNSIILSHGKLIAKMPRCIILHQHTCTYIFGTHCRGTSHIFIFSFHSLHMFFITFFIKSVHFTKPYIFFYFNYEINLDK